MDDDTPAEAPMGRLLSRDERDALVIELVRSHAPGLLRLARRHSLCADDAQDAYQRGIEILLRHAGRLDPERAPSWLRTVVKHEAMAVRRTRQRDLAATEIDFDHLEARTSASPEERVASIEQVARSAEALQRLKPQELRALWLRAQGNSYEEIERLTGWSRTKVNRCLYEGRRSFLERYAGIEAGMECERWAPLLSALVDGEASPQQLVEIRPHLRSCAACRATVRELHRAAAPLRAIFPGVGLALAAVEPEATVGIAARVHDSVAVWLTERTATATLRLQAAVDGLQGSAGKATAVVAASAAVAAGGGVALQQQGAASGRTAAPAALGRATSPSEARGSQRELTVSQEVARRLAAIRRRTERRRPDAAAPASGVPHVAAGRAVTAAAPMPERVPPAATEPATRLTSRGGGTRADLGIE